MNKFECIDVSYKTHPNWILVDAIYMSCSVPIFFSPMILGNKCYIDGSLSMNYPLIKCINDIGCDKKEEIFGFLLKEEKIDNEASYISETSNFFDYVMLVIQSFLKSRFFMTDVSCKIPYEICIPCPNPTLDNIDKCIHSSEYRRLLIQEGANTMHNWIMLQDIANIEKTAKN